MNILFSFYLIYFFFINIITLSFSELRFNTHNNTLCSLQESENNNPKCNQYTKDCFNTFINNEELELRCYLQKVNGYYSEYENKIRCKITSNCLNISCQKHFSIINTYYTFINQSKVCNNGIWGTMVDCNWGPTKCECRVNKNNNTISF